MKTTDQLATIDTVQLKHVTGGCGGGGGQQKKLGNRAQPAQAEGASQ